MRSLLPQYGIVILAAGASARLGQPKQLLVHEGKALLQRAIDIAEQATGHQPVVVTGAHAEKLLSSIDHRSAFFVYNGQWEEGMASSIRVGMKALMNMLPHAQAAIILVCDQPFITIDLVKSLIGRHEEGKRIVASAYSGTLGVPALFDKAFFDELLQLKGQDGARKVLAHHAEEVGAVDFERGGIDIDTAHDLKFLDKEQTTD